MSNDPIDFSALDPSADSKHWEQLLHSVTARAVRAQRSTSMAQQLVRWSRPALVAASIAAMVTWSGSLRTEATQSSAELGQESSSSQLVRWAATDTPRSTFQILQAFERAQ